MQLQQITASQHHSALLFSDALKHATYQTNHATQTWLNLLNATSITLSSATTTALLAPLRIFAPLPR